MARRVSDKTLDSKSARLELDVRAKPYYRVLDRGVHLGYRRCVGPAAGTWVARYYVGERNYIVERIGTADDHSDADGVEILEFWQAADRAKERMRARRQGGAEIAKPYLVSDAVAAYVKYLKANGQAVADVQYRADAFILPNLGKIEAAGLTASRLRDWLTSIADGRARLRSKAGTKQKFKDHADDDESVRKRRSSANRILTVLKAALNLAFREGKVASDREWRVVKPFRGVDAARVRYLSVAEAQRLINASDATFRPMVEAALQTGARYSELCRLRVSDFNPDAGTVSIRKSKSAKPRHVVLTEEGGAVFKRLCAGKLGNALIFEKASGAWKAAHQSRPMRDACATAKIEPAISFHGLRHTWASLAVMQGVPLMVVARNLGHADTRMVERHYGHLAPSFIADAIRAGAPRFGSEADNVQSIR